MALQIKDEQETPAESLNETAADETQEGEGTVSEEFKMQVEQLLASANPAERQYLQDECMKPSEGSVTMEDFDKAMS